MSLYHCPRGERERKKGQEFLRGNIFVVVFAVF